VEDYVIIDTRFCGSGHALLALLAALLWNPVGASALELSLSDAISIAQTNDPWISGSRYREQALAAQSTAAGALPDPMVSAGFANLPTDTFDFNQEPMTQFSVGISQVLPRGDSRELRQEQLTLLGAQHPYQRLDRRARVAAEVSVHWLEAWRAAAAIREIERDSDLFLQLRDVAESNYVNSRKGSRQQDLVFAEAELARLEDRLVLLREERDVALAKLREWVHGGAAQGSPPPYELPGEPAELSLHAPRFFVVDQVPDPQQLAAALQEHPALRTIEQRLAASSTAISLAQQQYQPEWRLNASYGYRDDDPLGRPRADFFSFGVSFDLPLFTSARQDQTVIAAQATAETVRTERALLLRRMVAELSTLHARLRRLNERQELYRARLLPDMRAQVDASLEAYTNDDGDFSEVLTARIVELNTRVAAIDIDVNRQKSIAQINYFFRFASTDQDH
jgi:outer membrane protein TolC